MEDIMVKCRQCKFWGVPNRSGYNDFSDFVPVHKPCGHVNKIVFHSWSRKEYAKDGLIFSADIVMGGEFGCIHGETNA